MAHYPKYQLVIDNILEKINSKILSAGDKIPNENELSQTLDVSNITVRKAMSELVKDGVIYRVRGKGSFVSGGPSQSTRESTRLAAFLFAELGFNDNTYMQLMIHIRNYLIEHNYSLIIESTGNTAEQELSAIQRLIDKQVEGFIIFSREPEKSIPNYQLLTNKNIPFVLVDRRTSLFPSNFAGSNNHDGAFSAVRHLLELLHTGIAFVATHISLSSERERFEGYCSALASMSLKVNREHCFLDAETDFKRLNACIRDGSITAVMTANEQCAVMVLNYLQAEGFRIPEDVSVVSFDDSDAIRQVVQLTTVNQFFGEIGRTAAQLLIENINNPKYTCTSVGIGTRLVIRESTRKLK